MPDFTTLVSNAVDAACENLISFLQKMVQASSLPNHEHEVQNLVAQKLRSMGLEVEIVPSNFGYLKNHPAFGDDGFSPNERINVIGRWVWTQTGK